MMRLKLNNTRVFLVLAIVVLLLMYWVGEQVFTELDRAHLVQNPAPRQVQPETKNHLQTLSPLLSKSSSHPAAPPSSVETVPPKQTHLVPAFSEQVDERAAVDRVFEVPQQPVLQAGKGQSVEPIDYFMQLRATGVVRIDGIASNGAVLNGHFYAVGEVLDAFSYPAFEGQQVRPILSKVSHDYIVIQESVGQKRSIRLSVTLG